MINIINETEKSSVVMAKESVKSQNPQNIWLQIIVSKMFRRNGRLPAHVAQRRRGSPPGNG